MNCVIVDFETYYDNDYSLSKMPTMQYVRDPRFRILGCGFKLGEHEEPFFASGPRAVSEVIGKVDWSKTVAVAHNASFDGAVLSEKFGVRPKLWLDTSLIARWAIAQGYLPPNLTTSLSSLASFLGLEKGDTKAAVDAGGRVLADYGVNDIQITYAILQHLLSFHPPYEELVYMDLHVRMATEPVLSLDEAVLERAATQTVENAEIHRLLRKDANFERILTCLGVEVEYKTTPTGRTKPAFSKTDSFMRELLEHEDPKVAQYAELRLSATSNILRTRAQRMLDVGEPFPVPLLYYAAITGRSGGSDKLNLQNLPRKGPLREALMAPPGYRLVIGDSSQIEARVVAWLAGDENFLDLFKHADPYRVFGGKYIYGVAPEELTSEQRRIAKSAVLGLGFGQRESGFMRYCAANGVSVDAETAAAAVEAYQGGFDRVPALWRTLERDVRRNGYLVTPAGRKIVYPELHEEDRHLMYVRPAIFSRGRRGQRIVSKIWYGSICENLVQATARDAFFWQVLQLRREGFRVVHLVHDEVVTVVPEEQAEEAAERLLYWLRTPPPWAEGLPLTGEVGIGVRYSECK